jgi:hypothetical protein
MKHGRQRSNDCYWRSRKLNAARRKTEENEKRKLARSRKKRKQSARREKRLKGRSEGSFSLAVFFQKLVANKT